MTVVRMLSTRTYISSQHLRIHHVVIFVIAQLSCLSIVVMVTAGVYCSALKP